jgi:heme exporter protein C
MCRRLARHDVLRGHGGLGARHADLAPSAGRRLDQGGRAPIGAAFTFLSLATGSLWGKPMWGTWWVWDARLTSVFVLFLMYLGVIALQRAMDDPVKAARPVAILVLIGTVNLPIIKFSVEWWNTLHQSASITLTESKMDPSLMWPLLVMALGFTLLFFFLHMVAMRTEIWRRRVASLRRASAREKRPSATPVLAE